MNFLANVIVVLLLAGCLQDPIKAPTQEIPETPEDTVHLSVVGAPTLVAPAQGLQNTPWIVALTWSWSEGSPPWDYRVQMSTDSLFSTYTMNIIFKGNPLQNRGGLAYSTKYYWRVRVEKSDSIGPWSARGWFVTEPAPVVLEPGNEYLLMFPAYGADDVPLHTSLVWKHAARATSYRIQFGTDTSFSTVQLDTTVSDTSIEVVNLMHLGSYHWRVQAQNSHGVTGWTSSRFQAFSSYDIFNRAAVGDQWVYAYDESNRYSTTSELKVGLIKVTLQSLVVSGDTAAYTFLVSDSLCTGTSFADREEPIVYTCKVSSDVPKTIMLNKASNKIISGGFTAHPLFSYRESVPNYQNTIIGVGTQANKKALRVQWDGDGWQSSYLESVGRVRAVYSSSFGMRSQYIKVGLQLYNGDQISSDSLAPLVP